MGGPLYNPNRNTQLKGRKRFSADFVDIQEACASGFVLHGLKLKSRSSSSKIPYDTETSSEIRRGEDDGSIEVVIENCLGKHLLSATLLISGKWPM